MSLKTISEMFNGHSVGGLQDFHNEHLKQTDLNYAKIEGGAEKIGRIETGQDQHRESFNADEKKKKKETLQYLLGRFEEHRKWLIEQMEMLQDIIDDLTHKSEEYQRNIEALENFLEKFEQNGAYDLGEDGYPKNNRVRELVKAFEDRTGQKWDASSEQADEILTRILEERKQVQLKSVAQRNEHQDRWNELNNSYNATEASIEKIKKGEYVSTEELDTWTDFYNQEPQKSDKLSNDKLSLDHLLELKP